MGNKILETPYGAFAAQYASGSLAELCVKDGGVQTGPFGSLLHQEDYVAVGTPIITVEHLGENRIIHEGVPKVSNEDRDRLSRFLLKEGDIVFSRVGSVDRRALVRSEEDGWLFSGRCLRVRPNHKLIDSVYLSYFFGLPKFQEYIRRIAVGATMPSLNTKLLSNVPIYYPKLADQRIIAHILGTLDDKIELNRRMNETLEEAARALFKSWFVDFDPVRARAEGRQPEGIDAETAALFPSEFEGSELGEIPKGWKIGKLAYIATEIRNGVNPEEIDASTPYIGLEHMPRQSISLGTWGVAKAVTSTKFAFSEGDILFGKLRPYFHKVGVAPLNGICSTDIVVLNSIEPCWFGFTLGVVSSKAFVNYTSMASTGTRMPRTKWTDMARYQLVLPSEAVAKAFNDLVSVSIKYFLASIFESRTLSVARDFLLSHLLSGETRVEELDVCSL